MATVQRITPFLWFDDRAEEAATFYTGIFRNSSIKTVTRYTSAGQETHQRPAGTAMTVAFELDGQAFTALNGGPAFKFNEAVSFLVSCANQEEIDYFWDKLSVGGDPNAQQCGWLKDRFGLSWQVGPEAMGEFFKDDGKGGAQRAMNAMLAMKKIDIAKMRQAYEGR